MENGLRRKINHFYAKTNYYDSAFPNLFIANSVQLKIVDNSKMEVIFFS